MRLITHPQASRHVAVEGCFNVRDAGGWPTDDGKWMRTGVLYRADEPVRLTDAGRAAIAALGLRAVIDLRQRAQVERGHLFTDSDLTHHIPVVDRVIDVDRPPARFEDATDLVDLYEDLVDRGAKQLGNAVETVAEHIADGPVLVHCLAGKDRTGLLVALIHAAIGVTAESIVEEYALSDEPTRRRRQAMLAAPVEGDPPIHLSPELIWTAPAEVMAAYVRRVADRHGGVGEWPAAIGVPAAVIDRLRDRLIVSSDE